MWQILKGKFTYKKKTHSPLSFEEWKIDLNSVEPFNFDFTEEREEIRKLFRLDEPKPDPEFLAEQIPEKTVLEMVRFQKGCCIFHNIGYREACKPLTCPSISTTNK